MRKVFNDLSLNIEMNDSGYVIVDIASKNTITKLIELFDLKDYNSAKNTDFYATIHKSNIEEKSKIYSKIMELINNECEEIFDEYKPLFANFIYKQGNSQNEVGIHQDWTYVDENIYNSVNVWLPLCNTDWQNGGLFLLPKSHKIDFHIRSTPFEDIFEKYKNKIHEKSISIQTKLGQAVIYDSRLIHFSTPNYTPNYRVACACIFIPNESTPLHFYKEKEIIYKYEVESAFYINYDPFKKPLNNPQGFILKKSLVNNTPIIEFLKKL